MAQAFEDFDGYPTGALTGPWGDTWGSYNIQEVVSIPSDHLETHSTALGARALRLNSGTSGSARRATKYTALSGSASDEIFAIVGASDSGSHVIPNLVLRGSGTSEATRTGYVLFIREGSNDFEIRKKTNGSSSTLSSRATIVANALRDYALACRFSIVQNGSGINYTAKVWRFGFDDEADATTISGTDASPLSQGWLGVGLIIVQSETKAFFGSVGFGTDGDPAPTGPIESFQLRHNPRTNKVIPVLSAPTVTDIGANCVRPRVTKGF